MKKIFSILLYLGILTSCTTEVAISPEVDGDNSTYGELAILMRSPESATPAGWVYDDYFPDGDIFSPDGEQERWLLNISLVYFDSNMQLEKFGIGQNFAGNDGMGIDNYARITWNKGYPEYMLFTLGIGDFPVTTGSHYFYVFCNAPDQYLEDMVNLYGTGIGLTKDQFEKTVMTGYTIEDIAAPFISKGGNSQPRCMMTNITSPEPHYLASSIGYMFPDINYIDINLGKSFAKVSLAYIPEDNKERLAYVQYRILNDPKNPYLFPNIFNGQVYTPHYDKWQGGNFEQYFEQYFNENSGLSKIDDPENTFLGWRWASRPDSREPKNINQGEEAYKKTHLYCLENGNQTPLQGNSTMVLVKAQYIPEEWLNSDGTKGEKSGDGTFWRIRNSLGYAHGYYNDRPDVALDYEIVKYTQGITYYPIWLETNGKYQVIRNHYYKIAITDVIGAGANSPEAAFSPKENLVYNSAGTRSVGSSDKFPEAATAIKWIQNN